MKIKRRVRKVDECLCNMGSSYAGVYDWLQPLRDKKALGYNKLILQEKLICCSTDCNVDKLFFLLRPKSDYPIALIFTSLERIVRLTLSVA